MNSFLIINFFNSIFYIIFYLIITILSSFIYSNSIETFTLFSGIYLFSMGIPSLIKFRNYFKNIYILGIISNFLFITTLVNIKYSYLDHSYINIFTIIFLGFSSGFEIPFFIQKKEKFEIITSDYIGTFIGMILFPFILYPFFGIYLSSIILLFLFNLFYIILNQSKMKYVFIIFNLIYISIHFLY